MGRTSIEWTDYSWPVVNGCRRVSPGCENCYAERLAATRVSKMPKYAGLAVMKHAAGRAPRPRWTGETRLWVKDLDMPLRLKRPARIFVADMGDLFYGGVSDEQIAAVFGVMAAASRHTFQVLTKRPERMREWVKFDWWQDSSGRCWTPAEVCRHWALNMMPGARNGDGTIAEKAAPLLGYDTRWPLPNVWLGTSVENQVTADERIPHLLATSAAVHFVSAEPLLGPVRLDPAVLGPVVPPDSFDAPVVSWVIVGGESGPGARPMNLGWARHLVQTCAAAGAACFVKQLGAWPYYEAIQGDQDTRWEVNLRHRKGAEPEEWPPDLRVRQFPGSTPKPQAFSSPSDEREKEEVGRGGGLDSRPITAT